MNFKEAYFAENEVERMHRFNDKNLSMKCKNRKEMSYQ